MNAASANDLEVEFLGLCDRRVGIASASLASLPVTPFPERWAIDWPHEPSRFTLKSATRTIELPSGPLPQLLGSMEDATFALGIEDRKDPLRLLGVLLQLGCAPTELRIDFTGMKSPTSGERETAPLAPGTFLELPPSSRKHARAVPSGGGLFPWELYVVSDEPAFAGVHHYDLLNHRLCTMDADAPRIEQLLEIGTDREAQGQSSVTLVVTARFWKSYFKYGNAALHLYHFDSGILAEQILFLARALNLNSKLIYKIPIERLTQCLRIDPEAEAPLLAIRLEIPASPPDDRGRAIDRAFDTPKTWEGQHRSQCNFLAREFFSAPRASVCQPPTPPMAAASRELSPVATRPKESRPPRTGDLTPDLVTRRTGIHSVQRHTLGSGHLNWLLHRAAAVTTSDWGGRNQVSSLVGLRVVAMRVEDLTPGAYEYDFTTCDLLPRHCMDLESEAAAIQAAYKLENINVFAASCWLVFTLKSSGLASGAGQEFQIAELEVGQACQRLVATGRGLDLGVHPLFGILHQPMAELLRINLHREMPVLSVLIGNRPDHAGLALPLLP